MTCMLGNVTSDVCDDPLECDVLVCLPPPGDAAGRVERQRGDGLVGEGPHSAVEIDDACRRFILGGVPIGLRVGLVDRFGDDLIWGWPMPCQREAKQARTRARIQREASRLLLERGYEATTLPAIAAAADLAPRTLFSYFENKESHLLGRRAEPSWLPWSRRSSSASHTTRQPSSQECSSKRQHWAAPVRCTEGHDVHAVLLAIMTTPQLAGALALQTAATASSALRALAAHCDVPLHDAHALVGTTFGLFSSQVLFRGPEELTDETLERGHGEHAAARSCPLEGHPVRTGRRLQPSLGSTTI